MDANGLAALMVIAMLVAVIGYFLNIFRLAAVKTLTGLSLLRLTGLFLFPIGCILGFVANAPEPTKELVLIKSEIEGNDNGI